MSLPKNSMLTITMTMMMEYVFLNWKLQNWKLMMSLMSFVHMIYLVTYCPWIYVYWLVDIVFLFGQQRLEDFWHPLQVRERKTTSLWNENKLRIKSWILTFIAKGLFENPININQLKYWKDDLLSVFSFDCCVSVLLNKFHWVDKITHIFWQYLMR